MYASVSCIQIGMMEDGLVFAADESQSVRRSSRLGVWARADDAHQLTPGPGKHEPEASSVSAVSAAATPFRRYRSYRNNISRGSHYPISNTFKSFSFDGNIYFII